MNIYPRYCITRPSHY